ncbi:GNAT family N-acetyltransferase [Rhodanobacter umsongensis]|uniref:GNAT family N-acetyltransferase n=1 Tax=Rhodanobacter umsongensis TaxID=633153 RepID=A0ABW0JJA7_9GAMM
MSATCLVRRAQPGDLDALLMLCTEHARHEGTEHALAGNAGALAQALFSTPPRLHAWVVEARGQLVGYATASAEFSTWQAGEFLHMDCLFVCVGWRGNGIGAALMEALVDFARCENFMEIQWQTPDWNVDAARFYRWLGAEEKRKRRFFLGT